MLQVGNDPFIAPMMCGFPCIIANALAKTLNQNSLGNCMNNLKYIISPC